jgi:hypothetical protein
MADLDVDGIDDDDDGDGDEQETKHLPTSLPLLRCFHA